MSICKWCGKTYTKKHNREMYCSDDCRHYARQEQNRTHRRRYYHRYKHVMTEKQRCGLGSGFLSCNRHKDHLVEYAAIQREYSRLKLF